ncbi:MAG: ATP-binding protein, partial [Archangiaceae bacterium]|nr:ATP-binding protein [Archangiaceae bacterium]
MSAPRPIGSTSLQTAFTPRIQTNTTPALAPSSAHDGRVGRIGELMGKLGFPLSPDRVAREERARAALPSTMPIAWLLGVEWVRANDPEALGALVTLTTDIASTFGGALDLIDATGATFIFFGLGSQGACVLAAQELRERIEALADGRPDAPSLRLAVAGSRLRAEPDHAAEGDGLNALQSLLRKAQAGQCLLARNLANGVSDLVGTTPTIEEVQLSSRKPSPAGALPTVAFEPVLKLLDLRVAGLERGVVAPVVITGARRSGRTHLAFEFARRASNQKVLVGFTSSLKGERAPLSSLAELVCGLCDVPFDDRHTALGPAMEKLGVAPIRREAMLAALQLSPTPAVFTTNQVVDALRLVLADLTQGKPRVVVFDALDQADDATVEVVRV